jgi:hypothetical protein
MHTHVIQYVRTLWPKTKIERRGGDGFNVRNRRSDLHHRTGFYTQTQSITKKWGPFP